MVDGLQVPITAPLIVSCSPAPHVAVAMLVPGGDASSQPTTGVFAARTGPSVSSSGSASTSPSPAPSLWHFPAG